MIYKWIIIVIYVVKHKNKKTHINSKKQIFLSYLATNRYQINNPKHDEIEDILEKNIQEHRKIFLVHWVICKFKTTSKTFTLPKLVIIEVDKEQNKGNIDILKCVVCRTYCNYT